MNRFILLLVLLTTFTISKAQISALTESGRQVTLYNNGTWKYNDSTENKKFPDSITTNSARFLKSGGATFLVKSKIVNVGVFINPNKWTFTLPNENEVHTEYKFSLKSGDGMAILESEKTPIGLENMVNVALINAKKAAVDAKILTREYRIVNNKKILFLEMSGTIQGIKFRYMGYYFSNETGTVQLLSFTTDALYKGVNKELETFLNGFIETNKN